jgi:hypothetical protein
VVGTSYDTPSIITPVQEIVDRTDWTNGGNMVIFVEDDGSDAGGRRNPASWDSAANPEPELHLRWAVWTQRGRADTCEKTFVANRENVSNITHVYVDNGGAFGPNLLTQAMPAGYALLPAVPAVNDALYFGTETTLADSGPFGNVILEIGTAWVQNAQAAVWQYWSSAVGGSWQSLSAPLFITDESASLSLTGTRAVSFQQDGTWVAVDLSVAAAGAPAITGFWIRMLVTGAGIPVTSVPTQVTRQPYSVTWPYVSVASDQVEGDILALARAHLFNHSDTYNSTPNFYADRVMLGLRSEERGTNFKLWLNCSDEQNPAGTTVSCLTALSVFATSGNPPTGRWIAYSPVAAQAIRDEVSIALDSTLVTHFYGRFRCFLRCAMDLGATPADITMQLKVWTTVGDAVTHLSDVVSPPVTAGLLMDFGTFDIGAPDAVGASEPVPTTLTIRLGSADATPPATTLYLYDVALLPVDEWAAECLNYTNSDDSQLGRLVGGVRRYLDVDSLGNPYTRFRCPLRLESTAELVSYWTGRPSGEFILRPRKAQRLYVLGARYSLWGTTQWQANIGLVNSLQLFNNRRYFDLRGER